VPAFRVKLGTNELNCVDVLLNPTHSLTQAVSLNVCMNSAVNLTHYVTLSDVRYTTQEV